MFVTERVKPSLLINYQFSRKRNVHIYIIILCQVNLSAANTVKSCKHPTLLGFSPISNISPIIDPCSFFNRIRADILMNVLDLVFRNK